MKFHPLPAVPPRGASRPPSPPRYVLPKVFAAAAAALLAVGAACAPPAAVRGFFGLFERRGGARGGAVAAFTQGAFRDDPGPVPDGSVANQLWMMAGAERREGDAPIVNVSCVLGKCQPLRDNLQSSFCGMDTTSIDHLLNPPEEVSNLIGLGFGLGWGVTKLADFSEDNTACDDLSIFPKWMVAILLGSMGGSSVSAASVTNLKEKAKGGSAMLEEGTFAISKDTAEAAAKVFLVKEDQGHADDGNSEEPPNPDPDESSSSVEGFDCQDLQEMSEDNPDMIAGSTLSIAKELCDQGNITTSDEVAEVLNQYEGSNPDLDDQVAIMATQLCEKALLMDSEFMNETKNACAEDPRNDEHVVDVAANDVAARLQAQQSPTNTTEDSIDLASMCTSLSENREEIEAGLEVLESRSNQRRLDDSNTTRVTSFSIGTRLIEMLDCYCDTDNTANKGCTRKSLRFAEATAQSVMEQAEDDFGENPENDVFELESALKKHTNHLRVRSGFDHDPSTKSESDLHASVERALVEVGVEKCHPPGVQHTHNNGGYSICLYAGSVFECSFQWNPHAGGCVNFNCGGGNSLQIQADAQFCTHPSVALNLELKLCINVVSEILEVVGRHLPAAESFFNTFGVYSGCYRLAKMEYDITHQRFRITAGPHSFSFSSLSPIRVRIGGKAYMRFKGRDCNYNDDALWAAYEYIAATHNPGLISDFNTKLSQAKGEGNGVVANRRCNYRIGQWAVFEIEFGIEFHYWFDKDTLWSTAKHFVAGGVVEPLARVTSLSHGDLIYLKHVSHNAYLGLCGPVSGCDTNEHGVYGYSGRLSRRTLWQVESYGGGYYFRQTFHKTYLGMCGGANCSGSKHHVYGFRGKPARTLWTVENRSGVSYIRQPLHNTYLGMCGWRTGCDASLYGVYGYDSMSSRTGWMIERAITNQLSHGQPDGTAVVP